MIRFFSAIFIGFFSVLAAISGAQAQSDGPFSPHVIVNGQAITNWELDQRIAFLQLLRAPGNLEEEALNGLIEDRLRLDATRAVGIRLSTDEIIVGMTEFAGRSNLELDAFVAAIEQSGVARETFADFVEAGIAWRQLVQGRFGPRAQVSDAEVDRAVALITRTGSARVLLSEIILRADTPEFAKESQELAQRLAEEIKSPEAFAAAARRYSVSNSAGRGGRIDWLDLANLPSQISSLVLSLGPGDVTDPIPVPNAIALFQLRAIEEEDLPEPESLSVEYAQFFFPAGEQAKAQKLQGEVDTCDDLYGAALKLPEDRLTRDVSTIADLDAGLALELAKLDSGETTLRTAQNGAITVLMLCGRTPDLGEEFDRDRLRISLFNQRLASYADGFMAELKADAIIRTP